ncbi:adhesion G-protein coupled receptor G4 [Rhynchocyon petersi]
MGEEPSTEQVIADALSLRGKKLDFHGKGNTYVILDNSIPELSRFTACIDLVFMDDVSRNWIAFSYVTTNTFLGREDIDLGLAGNHHYLILYNLGKTYYIHYHLTPFQWYTICLIWDGVKGRLELFLNKERLLVMRDQPQTLRPNGTLVLGNVPRNGEGHIKRVMPSFTGSLYYFQLWDRILENKEFMKCLDGNVVSWEEDAWLIHKIIPTVDKRLRCSVSDNITIQGTSTTLSQQIDLTTPYQVTGLKPQQTLYSSIVMSKSTPVFATDYTAILYSNKTSPPLETVTASKTAQPSIAETPALAVDIASASSAITLPTKSTAIITPKYSMKTSKSLSSQRTVTTKMVEAIASETFHPTSATAFLHTSGFTKNSVVSKTSATRSQADIMKTSLFLSVEPASMSPTSWLTHKSTNNGGFPVSTTGQAFPTAAGTVPWSTVDQTAATTPHTRVVSAVSPETELISTAVPVNSVFPRNQTTSILATSDAERAFTVHSVTLPTRSIETMPSLRTAEIDLTSTNFQAVSSPRVEDDLLTSMPNKASSMALSFKTLSSLTGTQSVQTPTDTETTLTGLTTGVTLSPTVADTILSPTTARPIYTQNIPTVGENMLSLSSTRSVSIGNTSVSGLAPVTNATSHLFSTNSTAWTSKPDQNLLTSVNTSTMLTCMPKEKFTSAFRRVTSHPEHSPTTTNNIITPETSAESKATFAIITTKSRYTTAVSNLISPWFANFSTVSGTTSVPKPSEFNPTTLLPKGPLMSTVAANALLSTPKETAASPEDRKSTLADTKSNYSTKTSSSETTQTETNDTLGFGKATAFVSKSMTTQMPQVTGSRKETASHYFQGRSTTEMTPEVAPFATILEATDGSSQMVTASTTISPSSDMETSSPPVDDKTVATELRSSLMTTSVKTTPRSVSLYSGSSDVFSSTHTYTARWTLKTLPGGNAAPPPSYGSTQPFPELLDFPDLGTAITPDNAHSSWNTLAFTNPQFPTSTTAHVPSHDKMETATLLLVPGSLAVVTGSQTDLVSEDVTLKSSTPTSGILPALDLSESPTLSTSSRTILTTFADIKQTVDKITTFVNPGITVTSKPVSITESTVSKAPALPTPIGISSRFPLGSPVATIARDPQLVTSSTAEKSKSTFPTSDMTLTHPFTTFTTLPLPTVDTILTKTTPIPTPITTDFQTSLSMFLKSTDGNMYISTSSGAFPRSTVMANSRTQLPSFNRMNTSPLASDHTLSVGSIPLSSSTVTSSQSSIPAVSVFPTLASPKPTLDSHPNRTTTMTSVTRNSFPLVSIGMTHPFTATVSSLISSSFKPTRLDSTPSFLSRGTLTSTMAAKYSVSFYNIEMNFSFFDGESRIPISSVINEFAKYWLNSIFQDSEFVLANLATQIKSRDTSEEEMTMDRAIWEQREGQGMTPVSRVPYSCVCQVIIKANSSLAPTELINRIKSKIHGNLTHGNFTQDQLTLLVKSEHVAVKILEPGKCKADETASKFKGTYKWLLTNPTEIAQTRCIKNEDGNATRICSINIDTGKSQWEKPKFKQCKLLKGLPDRIMDLANITINDENANDVAEHILNLLSESPPLDEEETKIIVSKVSDISQSDEISMNLTQIILEIISAVLGKQSDSASELNQVRNEILRIIDRVGHKMEFVGRTANLTVARLALAVLRVDRTFEGMTFGIRFYEEGGNPEIYLGEVPLGKILASIYLPKSLKERVPFNNLHTILFNFFGQTSLFKSRTLTKALTTYVVSASISDMSIQNLADPVVITLQHIEGNQNYNQVHCAFWDFEKNNGLGGWNSSGCKVNETNVNYTICQCDHLTHFGVLMDLSRSAVDAVNERILVLITYTGCGISSIFLGIAIVTYVVFHKLRKDYPSKILVNLCTALLMLNMAFLVNSWSASFQKVELCIVAAVALHYFLLVSLTWMGLEAVHMYFALVKVFNIYIPNYIFKFCLVGWGIPAILVAVILSVKKDPYGTLNLVTPFCWIKDDSIFYISVVAYFCLIFILNLSMFCAVLVQLNSMKPQSQKTRRKMILHDLKGTTSLTFLLGLTWGFAFFAWGPVRLLFLYLFAIFNTMQGFLIFVFHCAMKESVRAQWQIHLCCRWFRLDNSSDASSRCGLDVGYKQQRLKKTFEHKLLTLSLESTATNSTLKSSGSTQDILSDMIFPNGEERKKKEEGLTFYKAIPETCN